MEPKLISNSQERLNDTQKNIIDGTLFFIFDAISELKSEEVKIRALEAIIRRIVSSEEIAEFKSLEIYECIEQIRNILSHPCPQNRNQSYPYVEQEKGFAIFKMDKFKYVKKDKQSVKEINTQTDKIGNILFQNGRIIPKTHIIRNSVLDHYFIAKEEIGLLGLTARENDETPYVTKGAVVNYITQQVITEMNKKILELNTKQKEPYFRTDCKEEDLTLVEELLKQGMNPNLSQKLGFKPLHWVAINGNVELAKILLQYGADLNQKNDFDETPLHRAAWSGKYDLVQFFILQGVDVNQLSAKGETALQGAIKYFPSEIYRKIISLLISNAATFNYEWIINHHQEFTGKFFGEIQYFEHFNYFMTLTNSLSTNDLDKMLCYFLRQKNRISVINYLLEKGADLQLVIEYYLTVENSDEIRSIQLLLAPYVINNEKSLQNDLDFLLENVDLDEINLDLIKNKKAARTFVIYINQLWDKSAGQKPAWLTKQHYIPLSNFADRMTNKILFPGLIDAINKFTDVDNFSFIKIAILSDSTGINIMATLDSVVKLYEKNLLSHINVEKLNFLHKKIETVLATHKTSNIQKPVLTEKDIQKIKMLVEPLHYALMDLDGNYSKNVDVSQKKPMFEKFSDIDGYPVKDRIKKITKSSDWTTLSFVNSNGKQKPLVELHKLESSDECRYSTTIWNR